MVPLLVEIAAVVTQTWGPSFFFSCTKTTTRVYRTVRERDAAMRCNAAHMQAVLLPRTPYSPTFHACWSLGEDDCVWLLSLFVHSVSHEQCSATPPVGCLYVHFATQKERTMASIALRRLFVPRCTSLCPSTTYLGRSSPSPPPSPDIFFFFF